MASTRQEAIKIAQKYVGCTQGSKLHKELVDKFNSVKPHGEVANYSCAWCSIMWTAVQIMAGNTSALVPMSYNCGKLIEDAKKLGIWQENDAFTPSVSDGIIYSWSDDGNGQCDTGADHVGFVEEVSEGYITVIEGNKGTTNTAGRRKIAVNGRFIRGFICPKYKETKAEKLAKEAKLISWPYGTARKKWDYVTGAPTSKCKTAMKGAGYDTKIEYSDCGKFQNTIIYHALGKKAKVLPRPAEPLHDTINGFKLVYKGKKLNLKKLKKYDIVCYKRKSNGEWKQHTGMYMGKVRNKDKKLVRVWAEAGRGDRFGVIRENSKFTSSNLKEVRIYRAVEE